MLLFVNVVVLMINESN